MRAFPEDFWHNTHYGSEDSDVKTFILGAGFSHLAGFPLVSGLRHDVLNFINGNPDPVYNGHLREHWLYPDGQFWGGLRTADPSDSSWDVEELLERLADLAAQNPLHPAGRTELVLRYATRRLLWSKHELMSELLGGNTNFADRLGSYWDKRELRAIISFDWDALIEQSLQKAHVPWSYSSFFVDGVPVLKPHGSINWSKHVEQGLRAEDPVWRPIRPGSTLSFYERDPVSDPFRNGPNYDLRYMIFPGDHQKDLTGKGSSLIWHEIEEALRESERVVFIGYSLPIYDTDFSSQLSEHCATKSVEVHNPNRKDLQKFAAFFPNLSSYPEKFEESSFALPITNKLKG